VPWDILAHDCGQDLDADHVANPRCFKSHEAWETIPKGARYIYVARHPLDAFVSFYHFLPDYDGLVSLSMPGGPTCLMNCLKRVHAPGTRRHHHAAVQGCHFCR
jgi:hypothetical protein